MKSVLVTGDFDLPGSRMSSVVTHIREPKSEDQIISCLAGISHYIIGGPEYIGRDILLHASELKHVIVLGTGTNSFIDVDVARQMGIRVSNTPYINANAVAEYAVAMVIVNLSHAFYSYEVMCKGGWYQKAHKCLDEAKIGIVGLGHIGKKVAEKISKISTGHLLYYSRSRKYFIESSLGLEYCNLRDMLTSCDAIIFCVEHNDSTRYMINREVLETVRNDVVLINMSSPHIFDPAALHDFLLRTGSRAFFDGYYNEWIFNSGINEDARGLINLGPSKFVATTHIAAQSIETINKLIERAFNIISDE